jgi:hypothetical protein
MESGPAHRLIDEGSGRYLHATTCPAELETAFPISPDILPCRFSFGGVELEFNLIGMVIAPSYAISAAYRALTVVYV